MTNITEISRRKVIQAGLSFLGLGLLAACKVPPATSTPPPSQTPGAFRPSPLLEYTSTPNPISPAESTPVPASEDLHLAKRQANQAKIADLAPKPLMSNADFMRINRALQTSAHPLGQLISPHLNKLWNGERDVKQFPDWISDTIAPLVVTYDTDVLSLCSIGGTYGGEMKFQISDEKKRTVPSPYISALNMGIALGSPLPSRNEGSVVEAMYMLKESINLFSVPALEPKMRSIFEDLYQYTFTGMKGEKLPATEDGKINPSLLTYFLNNQNGNFWKLFDGFPIALVASQLYPVVVKYKALQNSRGLIPFGLAYNMLQKPEYAKAKSNINTFVQKWIKSGSPVPPEDFFDTMIEHDTGTFVLALQSQLTALAQKK